MTGDPRQYIAKHITARSTPVGGPFSFQEDTMDFIKDQWSRFRSLPLKFQILAGFALFAAVCVVGGMIQGG